MISIYLSLGELWISETSLPGSYPRPDKKSCKKGAIGLELFEHIRTPEIITATGR
jgi:hypothetical protein